MITIVRSTVVNLRCPGCGDEFSVPRRWWSRRLLSGAPALRCSSCDPRAYDRPA